MGTPHRARIVLHATLTLALFFWARAVLDAARPQLAFHGDESSWIATSRHFWYFFLNGNVDAERWDDRFELLTQPSGFRYLVGATLWLRGLDPATLNKSYNWTLSLGENRRRGYVPSDDVLQDARMVGVLFGAVAVAMLYVVGVQLGAPLAGLVAGLVAGASPYLQGHFALAMAEPPFGAFLLATLAICLAVFRRSPSRFGLRTAGLAGLTLGAAFLLKLTAVLSAPAIAVACLAAGLRTKDEGRETKAPPLSTFLRPSSFVLRPLVWCAVLLVVAYGLFVALYPFLWTDPPGQTVEMFQHRQMEMGWQERMFRREAVRSFWDRPRLILGHVFVDRTWANTTLHLPLDVPLAMIGLASLGAAAWSDWFGRRRVGPPAVFLLWFATYFVGTLWAYRMDWDRYVVPLFLMGALMSGLGVAHIARWATSTAPAGRLLAGARRAFSDPGLRPYDQLADSRGGGAGS